MRIKHDLGGTSSPVATIANTRGTSVRSLLIDATAKRYSDHGRSLGRNVLEGQGSAIPSTVNPSVLVDMNLKDLEAESYL